MKLYQLLLTKNECYIVGRAMAPKGVMVHSTAANNPKLSRYVGPDDGRLGKNPYNNHWNAYHPGGNNAPPHAYVNNGAGRCKTCGGQRICCHAFIGKLADGSIATYQTLPWAMRGWHGASGPKGSVNDTHIGFEITEDDTRDPVYFRKVFTEAAELCAHLCKQFKLDPMRDGVVIGHAEGYRRGIASNHGDPDHWMKKHGESMDSFRAAVKRAMGGSAPAPGGLTHTYRDGETLWSLAVKYLGDGNRWTEIQALNGGPGACDPNRLRGGTVLKIPDGGGAK